MGLQDVEVDHGTGDTGTGQYPEAFMTYPNHEIEEQLWEWFEELEERFPQEIRCDFIEVSPELESCDAQAYWRERDGESYQYVRFAEHHIDSPDWRLRQTLIHEMAHLYCYQNGFKELSDSSPTFKWLCGRIGAPINSVQGSSGEWLQLMEPMIDDQTRVPDREDLLEDGSKRDGEVEVEVKHVEPPQEEF